MRAALLRYGIACLGVAVAAALLLACPRASAEAALPAQRPALQARQPARAAILALSRAGARIVAAGERGLILYSDDQGRTWTQAKVPVSVTLTAVSFVDGQHGWAGGHGSVILRTNDGGHHWEKQFGSEALAAAAGRRLQSASGGATAVFRQLAEPVADKPVLSIAFSDANHGIAVGAAGLVLRTVDAGAHWELASQELDNPKARHLYAVRLAGPLVLIAGEQGSGYLSRDGGATFASLSTPYRGSYFAAELGQKGAIVLGGLRGNVSTSLDFGKSWIQTKLATDAAVVAMAQDRGGEVILGTQGGQIFTLVPGEGAAVESPTRSPPMLASLLPVADEALLAAGLRGIERISERPNPR